MDTFCVSVRWSHEHHHQRSWLLLWRTKHFLRSVDNVKESIFIPFPFIQFSKGHGNGSHGSLVDQEEKCLVRVQLEPTSNDLDQFSNRDMIWNQKFGSIQDWKLLLSMKPFNDHWNLVWVQLTNFLDILLPLGCSFHFFVCYHRVKKRGRPDKIW